jgi:hypothetical protein
LRRLRCISLRHGAALPTLPILSTPPPTKTCGSPARRLTSRESKQRNRRSNWEKAGLNPQSPFSRNRQRAEAIDARLLQSILANGLIQPVEVQTEPRRWPENVKEKIVKERGYKNVRRVEKDPRFAQSVCEKYVVPTSVGVWKS